MKNNRLLWVGALVAIGALTACSGGSNTGTNTGTDTPAPDTGTQTPAPDVEVPEGKVAFTLTLGTGEGSVALKEYETPYVTGGFNGFATAVGEAVEMTKVEGQENLYVGYYDVDKIQTDHAQFLEYGVTLGYNEASMMPEAKRGVNWSFKSVECNAYEYPKNPVHTYEEGQKVIDLGVHTFDKNMAKPAEPRTNVHIRVRMAEAVPAWGTIYMQGTLTSWNTDAESLKANAMTPVDGDRTLWEKVLPGPVYCGDYELGICVEYTDTTNFGWNKPNEYAENGVDNWKISILDEYADLDGYVLELPTFTMNYEEKLPDPSITYAVTIVLENSGEGALAEGTVPAVVGNMVGWAYTAMTEVEGVWTLALELTKGDIEFGIVNANEGATNWKGAFKTLGEDGNFSNLTAKVPGACTIKIAGDFAKLGVEDSAGVVTVTPVTVA